MRSGALLLAAGLALASCNSKSDDDSTSIYMPSSSVAVTSFTLKSDEKVTSHLDSVFFSIDLNAGVIANPDSLPKGSRINKLVPVISYPASVTAATITMTGGETRQGEVNYRTNPSDSIDFTGRVVLRLVAEDGKTSREYLLKVNVHNSDPDTLAWTRLSATHLPSRLASPRQASTVRYKGNALCLLEESDGSLTLATSAEPAMGNWSMARATLPADAMINTLTATDNALYLLDSRGGLFSSADGMVWSDTGAVWTSITGGYGDLLLGIRNDVSGLLHTSWPRVSDIDEIPVSSAFPMTGTTDFGLFTSRWALRPVGFLTGGLLADGTPNARTWAFDGSRWADISENTPPALFGAVMVPYYTFTSTSTLWIKNEFSVWLLIGGRLADGSLNKEVWMTYDNGANWRLAPQSLQLPTTFPALLGADGVVLDRPYDVDINDGWTFDAAPRRVSPSEVIDGKVKWHCPYIYIFGGTTEEGKFHDGIMRGVITRLQYTPLL